ncbi:hypothetical protein AAGV28_07970 [Flavobacterium sp. FZUC8N2.13]|uniref:Uncharacterized protein n=1 Tax=Flavobacterium zubiriense TaxID=3138075 RepID=A0ABV4TB41_9FLAO
MAKAIFKINYHPPPANAGGNSRENAKSIGLGFSPFETNNTTQIGFSQNISQSFFNPKK